MVGNAIELPPDEVRRFRLNQIELARTSCRLGGRPIPDFIHQVENEIIAGTFR